MKSIYSYKNYRHYLQDYYQVQKEKSTAFTYAKFAKLAQLGSPNYFKLIMDEKRNLTISNIHSFAKSMKLSLAQTDYFEALVLENQSKTSLEQKYYSRRVNLIRKSELKQEESVARKEPTSALENVLNLGILILSNNQTLDDAVSRIMEELGLSHTKTMTILTALMEKGEIIKDELGKLKIGPRHTMMNDPKGLSERQRAFLESGLKESQEIFTQRYPLGSAKFLSLVLSAPSGCLKDMFDDLRRAVEGITQKYDPVQDQEVGVYRIQLQTYRLKKNEF